VYVCAKYAWVGVGVCVVLGGVEGGGGTSAGLHQALHVSALGPPQRQDAFLGQQVQGARVDALLVYHHESLPVLAHLDHRGSTVSQGRLSPMTSESLPFRSRQQGPKPCPS